MLLSYGVAVGPGVVQTRSVLAELPSVNMPSNTAGGSSQGQVVSTKLSTNTR